MHQIAMPWNRSAFSQLFFLRAFTVSVSFLALASPPHVLAQQPPSQPFSESPPRAELIEPLHDFGNISSDVKLSHTFRVMNVGGQPLLIKQVAPDCSCTTTIAHPATIKPGETSDFTFEINTAKLSGSFVRYINVLTNDPITPSITFSLTGDARRLVEIVPPSVSFGRIYGTEVREQTVTLTNRSGSPLHARIDGAARDGRFEFELTETIPGTEYRLFVVVRPPYEEGISNGTVRIATNFESQKSITITASAIVPPAIEVMPARILVGESSAPSGNAGGSQTKVCEVSNFSARPIHILNASSNDPAVVVATREVEPGRLYRVLATMRNDYRPPPEGRSITLKTDASENPEVIISILPGQSPPATSVKTPTDTTALNRPKNPVLELIGKQSPKFALQTTKGIPVGNSEFVDYPATVLNFVAPNCPFCKRQLPNIEKVRADYESRGVRFVNISETLHEKIFTQVETEAVFEAIDAHLELALDPGNKVGSLYKVSSFPALLIVSKEGKISDALVGSKDENVDILRSSLNTLLNAEANGGASRK